MKRGKDIHLQLMSTSFKQRTDSTAHRPLNLTHVTIFLIFEVVFIF